MKRYSITNLVSGRSYAFTDDDLAAKGTTLDEWLERKANAYGRGERREPVSRDFGWTIEEDPEVGLVQVVPATKAFIEIDPETGEEVEVSPAYPEIRTPLSEMHPDWYAVGTPVIDGDEVVIPAEYEITTEDITDEIREEAIAALWNKADRLALSIADHNSRARFLLWLMDPATPQAAKDMIAQVQGAMDLIWKQYATARAMVQAGQEPAPYSVPSNLPTFWQIADAATEEA